MVHATQLRRELLQQRDEGVVDEDHPVLGVVDDVDQLLLEQADVERVQHRTHARHREVQLQMALAVPRERAHSLALRHSQAGERARQAIDALGHLRVLGAQHRAVVLEREDLRARVVGGQAAADVVERQREVVLHQALQHLRHPLPTPSRGASCPRES